MRGCDLVAGHSQEMVRDNQQIKSTTIPRLDYVWHLADQFIASLAFPGHLFYEPTSITHCQKVLAHV